MHNEKSKLLLFCCLIFIQLSACSDQPKYAWDAFYDKNNNIQWRCRDLESAKFAKSSFCRDLPKEDNTWPKK